MTAKTQDGAEDYLELGRWALETPHAAALAAPDRELLTYPALWDHICTSSEALRQAGVQHGGVAVLAAPNGPEFVTAVLAITMHSACAPVDLALTGGEFQRLLARIDAASLVYQEGIQSPIVEVARERGMRLIPFQPSPDAPAGVFRLGDIEQPHAGKVGRQTGAALLLTTSATTDAPKLVPRSRATIRVGTQQDARALQLSAADRFLSLMPLCYSHGLSTLFSQLSCGGSVFCAPAFQAEKLQDWLEAFCPTWFSASPAIQQIILTLAHERPEIFRRMPLRFVRSAGAAPEPESTRRLEELLGVPVLDGYGLSEVTSVARNTLSWRKPGSVGRSAGTEVAIMDESGRLLPPEAEGEVVLRGPTVMSGYLDDPKANQAAFHNGWFRTGDLGRLDQDGFLFIVGRIKEMINRGGRKISPQEVDRALLLHPAVAEAASFAIPHRTLGDDVAAAVVLRAGADASEPELRGFVAQRLAAYKVPRHIVFGNEIPRTATGKPKRGVLAKTFRDLLAAGSQAQSHEGRPPDEVERQLLEIWRRVLGIEQIGIEDNFFDLGGNSLTAAAMLTQAALAWKVDQHRIPEADFFNQPTVAALAGMLRACADGPQDNLQLPNRVLILRSGNGRVPFFCFSSTELDPHQFRHLSRWLDPEQPLLVVCPAAAMQEGRLQQIEEVARQSLASIRALRPHGPYILGGFCYGGVVAFEAARQLLEEGEEVKLLALFDTPTPAYPRLAKGWRRYVRASADFLGSVLRGREPAPLEQIITQVRALARMAAGTRKGDPKGPASPVGAQNPPPDTRERSAMRKYAPCGLSIPIVHFIAGDVPVSNMSLRVRRLGWRDFAAGSFEVCSVPGDHLSIFSETNAPFLAAQLEPVLRAALSAGHQFPASAIQPRAGHSVAAAAD